VGFRRIEIPDFLSAVSIKSTYFSCDYTMYIICDIATQIECHPHGYLGGMSMSIYLIKPLANDDFSSKGLVSHQLKNILYVVVLHIHFFNQFRVMNQIRPD
jgi:hypothetical protein